jgi:ribosomal protein S18 acetylase RimI-like enzyme
MPLIIYKDDETLNFKHYSILPEETIALRLKNSTEPGYKLNKLALYLYFLYRNIIYYSYKKIETTLSEDIQNHSKVYEEKESNFSLTTNYQDPIYHYCVAAALGAMQEWQVKSNKMQCYIAYSDDNRIIGFIHFKEILLNSDPVIYIAQLGVIKGYSGKGIDRKLMECVLSHYPAGTQFSTATRKFNMEAIKMYTDDLKFAFTDGNVVQQLGYNNHYCGLKHETSLEEIKKINEKICRYEEADDNTNKISFGLSM